MASLIRPSYTRLIPADAKRIRKRGKPAVTWKGRNGKPVVGLVCEDNPARCLVRSETWWIHWHEKGRPRKMAASPDRSAAEQLRAKLLRRIEQIRAGAIPDVDTRADTLLTILAAEYCQHLTDKGRKEEHVANVKAQVLATIRGCKFLTFRDLDADKVSRFLAGMREQGKAIQTTNNYTVSVKAFAGWLADRFEAPHPLRRLKCLNPDTDQRKIRRVLSAVEFAYFLAVVRGDVKAPRANRKRRFDNLSRWALYLTAARTGFRASELASLTPASFDFEAGTVTVRAGYAKDKRTDTLPVSREVLKQLRPWIESRPPGKLWPGKWAEQHSASDMLKSDLKRAGIPYSVDGRDYDFHALRSQYGTDLARANVSPAKAQRLMRHKDIKLTMRHYVRLEIVDLRGEVDKLG